MTTPLLAIIGRPNVGKSTLFNRLVGGRPALVHDTPGLTRDRRYGECDYFGTTLRVVDTGGLDPEATREVIGAGIHRQALRAIDEADALLLVVDGRAGLSAIDVDLAKQLRATGKRVFLAVNKIDHVVREDLVHDFHRLGLGQPYAISSAHGRGIDALLEAIVDATKPPPPASAVRDNDDAPEEYDPLETKPEDALEPADDEDFEDEEGFDDEDPPDAPDDATSEAPEADDDTPEGRARRRARRDEQKGPLRVAFVGRPNAGKSALTNRLLGEERSLVHDAAGTTTDPVDTPFTIGAREYLLVDTAGIRRKAKIDEEIEKIAVTMAISQIARANVVVLVIDAAIGPAEQDARIAGMVEEAGRALVIALNKSDLIAGDAVKAQLRENTKDTFHFLSWAPTVLLSGLRGDGVDRLLDLVDQVAKEHRRRIPTAQLNRFFGEVIEEMPPPLHRGRAVRINYITQATSRPPTFVLWANTPEGVSPSYRRFIANRLRERYGFRGSPIRIAVKAKKDRHDFQP
ncbi:MAG: ribosome biogenesis GTPase Der [Deltaproteobacteria bacterium]|nr:ribosome biogenesis GTPase Der [Deltaproteobacteria bacterium]